MANQNPDANLVRVEQTESYALSAKPARPTEAAMPSEVVFSVHRPSLLPVQRVGLWRIVGAFAVSVVSDAVSAATEFVPPVQIAVDLATVGALWMLLGWRWVMLPAFLAEAIPGLALFPTWVLVTTACVASRAVRVPGSEKTPKRSG